MNKTQIESRLEAFLILKNSGIENYYINTNIEFYQKKYEETVGKPYSNEKLFKR